MILFILSGCDVSSRESGSDVKTVFGTDDRVEMTSDAMPWSAVGKVLSQGYACTGSLVGPDLVLTNAHCVIEEGGTLKKSLQFLPNYKGGKGSYQSFASTVWWGTSQYNQNRHSDWAIMRLNSRLGDQFGYFGIRILDFSNPSTMAGWFTLAGYSSDFMYGETAGVHQKCSVRGNLEDTLLHECDSKSGASGSGIFAKWDDSYQIVALHAAHLTNADGSSPAQGSTYSNDIANIAVKAEKFNAKISTLRANSEGRNASTFVHLCNKSGKGTIDAAIAYFDGNWKSKGWWNIEDGTCKEIAVAEKYSGDIFVYATTADKASVWNGGPYDFCVNLKEAFELNAADASCDMGSNFSKVNFSAAFTISPDKLNTWNFNP